MTLSLPLNTFLLVDIPCTKYSAYLIIDFSFILHCCKSLLFSNNEAWRKKQIESCFDVTTGIFDGAEVCELVGIYILYFFYIVCLYSIYSHLVYFSETYQGNIGMTDCLYCEMLMVNKLIECAKILSKYLKILASLSM